jgi:hypothetical protein
MLLRSSPSFHPSSSSLTLIQHNPVHHWSSPSLFPSAGRHTYALLSSPRHPLPNFPFSRSLIAWFSPLRLFHTSVCKRTINLNDILYVAGKMDAYKFPDYRLKRRMNDPSKTPLLLVACGSFSPITFLHLRMFIMGGDYVKFNTNFELIGGYLSPVSDAYKKQGLAPAEHRFVIKYIYISKR